MGVGSYDLLYVLRSRGGWFVIEKKNLEVLREIKRWGER